MTAPVLTKVLARSGFVVCACVAILLFGLPWVYAGDVPAPRQPWTNGQGIKFVPAGTDGVWFCVWDVRVKDYAPFAKATGRKIVHDTYNVPEKYAPGENDPVIAASWENANAYCDWLTKREHAAGTLAYDFVYRLPTDAEWSRAAGLDEPETGTPEEKNGKVTGVFPWGTQWPPPKDAGDFARSLTGRSSEEPMPVGSYAPNRYGLYDMAGNVPQWCEDNFDKTTNRYDPYPYDPTQGFRTLRGSSWNESKAENLLSSARDGNVPTSSSYGFRIVVSRPISPVNSSPDLVPALSRITGNPAPTPGDSVPSAPPGDDQPWTNTLGMKFAPAGTPGVLFGVWDVRVQDFGAFVEATHYHQPGGIDVMRLGGRDQKLILAFAFNPTATWDHPGFEQTPTSPVVGVNFKEIMSFCSWLTAKERREGKIGPGQSYRVPTNKEWDAAVGKSKWFWGDTWPPPNGAGNFDGNQDPNSNVPDVPPNVLPTINDHPRTTPVGIFRANAYGLYDMGGNVWQWTVEAISVGEDDKVETLGVTDDAVLTTNVSASLRGSSWFYTGKNGLVCGNTILLGPLNPGRTDDVGFRVVLAPPPKKPQMPKHPAHYTL